MKKKLLKLLLNIVFSIVLIGALSFVFDHTTDLPERIVRAVFMGTFLAIAFFLIDEKPWQKTKDGS